MSSEFRGGLQGAGGQDNRRQELQKLVQRKPAASWGVEACGQRGGELDRLVRIKSGASKENQRPDRAAVCSATKQVA